MNDTITSPSVTVDSSSGSGELAVLDVPTAYKISRYPEDLNAEDIPHYVMFFINLPESSKYIKTEELIADATSQSTENFDLLYGNNGRSLASGEQVAQAAAGKAIVGTAKAVASGLASGGSLKQRAVKAVGGGIGSAVKAAVPTAAVGTLMTLVNLRPKLKRINTAIALYMPDTVVADYNQSYQSVSLTDALGEIGSAAAITAGGVDALAGRMTPQSMETLVAGVSAFGGNGNAVRDIALRSAGAAINPQAELIFQGTPNRDFIFEFKFQPRSQSEAGQIKEIIRLFKMYSAPELITDMQNSRYLVPPAQFDIKFKFKNRDNSDNLFKISTCVLENMSVNYSSGGQFATYQDGHPLEISMQLRFKEVDIMFRQLIESGF